MSKEILKQLLNEILSLQIKLAEKREENKEDFKKLEQLANAYKLLKQEKEKEGKYLFLGGIVFAILFYLLIKILIAYFFGLKTNLFPISTWDWKQNLSLKRKQYKMENINIKPTFTGEFSKKGCSFL